MNKMSLTFVSFTKGILHRSGISRHDAGVFLASTCGTLLSSQGSDAHLIHSLSGLVWGNRSNLLPVTFPVNSPHRRVSRSEGVPIVHRSGAQSRTKFHAMEGGYLVEFAGPFQSPACCLRLRQQVKHYGLVTPQVKSLESRACRDLSRLVNGHVDAGQPRRRLRQRARTIPIVFFPRRSTNHPPAKASAESSAASASVTLTLLT